MPRIDILAGGASTQSRARRPLPDGWHPFVVSRGAVTETWRVEPESGVRLATMAVTWVFDQGGPVLGYTSRLNPLTKGILDEVARHEVFGPSSVVSAQEVDAAERLVAMVGPFLNAEKPRVRFTSDGSDACDMAIRLARAGTGREWFVSIGYHGSSVVFAHEPQRAGVPERYTDRRWDVTFGDTHALTSAFWGPPVAAVIVEVPSTDEKAVEFLQMCRQLCDTHGALLILDDIVTGFRLAPGGAAEHYGVKPDIACYGKAMSNGRGIAATVADAQIMDLLAEKVFFSCTYSGDAYNCAHVVGTLKTIEKTKGELYPYLWETGEVLRKGMADVGVTLIGHAPRMAMDMPEEKRRVLCAAVVERGVVIDRPFYVTRAHSQWHITRTAAAIMSALEAL